MDTILVRELMTQNAFYKKVCKILAEAIVSAAMHSPDCKSLVRPSAQCSCGLLAMKTYAAAILEMELRDEKTGEVHKGGPPDHGSGG